MGFSLSGAAGGAANALQEIEQELRQMRAAQLQQEHLRLAQQNANDNTAIRRATLESSDAARKQAAEQHRQQMAIQLGGVTPMGGELDAAAIETLTEGGMGSRIKGATLDSRNLSGVLDGGTAKGPVRIKGALRSEANAGKGPTWQGTDKQQYEGAQRDAQARLAATATDPRVRQYLEADAAGVKLPTELFKAPDHSAAYKEWQDAVSTGYKGSFTQYQTEDANRKRPVVNVAGQSTNTALKLADDYTRDSKDFTTMNGAMKRVTASAANPSAAGDMALLYNYMKLLDPGSVVRESEFATAAHSGSLPQQIQGAATKILNGQRLTPEQRADFVNRAQMLYAEAKATDATVRESYTQRGKKFGVDPSLIFTDLGEPGGGAAGGAGGRVYYDVNGKPVKR